MGHAHDFIFGHLTVITGARIPAEALTHFQQFHGERQVERQLPGGRTATAWLGRQIMLGGEITRLTRAAGPASRTIFHPATIHWAMPDGDIGWILLRECPRVDARASENLLVIQAIGDSTFQISAPGLTAADVGREGWKLPGLNVTVETDALGFEVTPREGGFDLKYREATKLVLRTAVGR